MFDSGKRVLVDYTALGSEGEA